MDQQMFETAAGRVSVKVKYQTDGRPKKGRIYVWGRPEPEWPTEPCVDGACESYTCRRAHCTWLLRWMGVEVTPQHWGWDDDTPQTRGWMNGPEADHRLWRKVRAAGIADEREALMAVMAADPRLTAFNLKFSDKAGCSCGCSPGWVVEGMWGMEAFVHFESADVMV